MLLKRFLPFVAALLLAAAPVRAQDDEDQPAAEHPSTVDYEKALAKQKKGQWKAARRAFRKFLKKWPESPHAQDAEHRSGDNAYLGTKQIWTSGPFERRIDVSVMGDGFTIDVGDQKMEARWADYCVDVLWNERAYSEYRNYFNIYFVRLASLEEGVDPNLSPEEIKKKQEKNRQRRRALNYKIDFSTALNCKAAGPQGQVMADRSLVYKWLQIADQDLPGCGHDRFVIAFARFGKLGMGGGGVANVGRPDKSVTVHEFGHAFSRLLDEYAINPMPPRGAWARTLKAPNAYPSLEEPKPEDVPWAHMLKKRVKGVGIYEGGATFKKGVWKPARSCAMNTGGNQFCPVCREQSIRVIYEYVNPIDATEPAPEKEVQAIEGDNTVLAITPMEPLKHHLVVDWYVAPLARRATTPGADGDRDEEPADDEPLEPVEGDDGDELTEAEMNELARLYGQQPMTRQQRSNPFQGNRASGNRAEYEEPPEGTKSKLGKAKKRRRSKPRQLLFPVGKLKPGNYRITAEVRDDTKWVIKDPKHLLKERVSWEVTVAEKPRSAAPRKPGN